MKPRILASNWILIEYCIRMRECEYPRSCHIFFRMSICLKFNSCEYQHQDISQDLVIMPQNPTPGFRWFEQKYIEIITFGVPWLIESWIFVIFLIFKCFVLHYFLLDSRKFTNKVRQFSITESMSSVSIRFNYFLNSNETSFQDSISVFATFGIYTTPIAFIFNNAE